ARVDPSDVVQEALLDAARRLPDYLAGPPLPFHLWLRQAACDRLREVGRRHLGAGCRPVSREVALPPRSSAVLAPVLRASGGGPLERLLEEELAQRVRLALARLSEEDAEVVLLRALEGLSNQEAAEVLGIRPAAASKRYTRALLRLGEMLRGLAQEDFPA